MSGLSLDKNGNLKININGGAQIIVEKTPGEWVEARNFFFTLTAKGKVTVNETADGQILYITPKALELSMFRMFKGEEEQYLE